MTLKEFYEQIDSDYKDVIKRLCDEDMIKKFVFKFPEDPSFNDLKDGLKKNDAEKAFCAIHTLKGVCSIWALKDCMRQAINLQKNSEAGSLIIVTNCIMQLKDCIRI